MAIHKLSPRKAATAGPGKHEDGGGLRLVVSEGGAKKWVLRFTFKGKRREMGLGSFPDTGLADARRKAENFRKLAKDGVDPINARDLEKQQYSTPTFTSCAARYIKSHRHSWRNAKHARQWVSTLKTYARPVIGKMPVDEVDTHHLLTILEPIWKTKTETAKRVQGRIENVLDFASAHKYRDEANPARWRGHLDKLLPKPSRVKEISHLPAMPYDEVSSFIAEMQRLTSISSKALQFLILTATRTSEVLNAEWHEIDLAKATWTVPAERMKARREHRVPLSTQAVELLSSLPQVQGNQFIFPGAGISDHSPIWRCFS
ncbi:tyrosine-type recombinase/integrase [Halomonas sp. PA16-9]|uniref:tyrosine-type recombinase/integrase n=1 Tax=Halomonas sp. PA16-9 TaxID=2576841 RepID=UPI0030ED6DCB